jgi:hypothetical protein
MPTNVLILATKYDRATQKTFKWAQNLQDRLIPYVESCFLLDVTGLCRAGSTMSDIIDFATHVIFYGHGEPDWWTALPSNPNAPLIGLGNIHHLHSSEVYAVCCSSLSGLGTTHGQQSGKNFVGYDQKFRFEFDNEQEFQNVVNDSAFNFILTGNPAQTVADLQSAWAQLANDFGTGPLKLRKNAVMAGSFAHSNGQRIGSRP